MRSRRSLARLLVLGLIVFSAGCGIDPDDHEQAADSSGESAGSVVDPVTDAASGDEEASGAVFDPGGASREIDNLYLPLLPGTTLVREGEAEGGAERVVSTVSHDTRIVDGVQSAILVERTFVEGEFVRETFQWFAQDAGGNVWKMGESSQRLSDGVEVGPAEGWEAGVAGAEPVLRMNVEPVVGDVYRPDRPSAAGGDPEVVRAVDVEVVLSDGSVHLCVETETAASAGPESRFYAPGLGIVLEENEAEGERLELVDALVDTAPILEPADFSSNITNPLFPFAPGTTFFHEGETEDGFFQSETVVTHRERMVMGIACREVEVLERLDGELYEVTIEWFAEDLEGNVWYFGEDVRDYRDGVVVSTEGSWEAGVDGGKPGIVMKANPRVGDSYRQEYHPRQAEDVAHVVAKDVPVVLQDGSEHICLVTQEEDTLEEDDGEREKERKFHAPGLGMVRETQVDGSQPIDLVKVERE